MTTKKHKVSIALQGGGAHGAFAWGVMDRLLEDGRFDIRGVSGTSAGGMNAASLIQGLLEGDNETARKKLNTYWMAISDMAAKMRFEPVNHQEKADFLDNEQDIFSLHNNLFQMMSGMMVQFLSPYQFNPSNKNVFLDFLKSFFDYDLFINDTSRRIFLGATHVKSGKIKIFSNEDMCADVLMASACLPHLFHTVEVKGDYYWDGGFIANPAIYPLMNLDADDIIVVQLTKTHCDEIPTSKDDIVDRLKEITYNGCLVREMRAIYFISKLIDQGMIKEGALRRFQTHIIKSEEAFKDLKLSSALNPKWEFITALKQKGRETAEQWIQKFFSQDPNDKDSLDKQFADFIS
jgi:NTE family protein